jgi:hypothetical protein
MKILNYKSLNEQTVYDQARSASKVTGISQKDMRRLVGANLKRDSRLEKIPTVNAFRNLSFSFVTQQSYNNFINANRPTNASAAASLLDVRNKMTYSFAVLYEGDSCYLYPYKRQTLTLDSMEYVKSYIKLDLKRRDDNTQENVQQYFSTFNPTRTPENEYNVKNYELTILSNFDDINKKYSVPAEVINLKTFKSPTPEPMYISMNAVSKEFLINTAYGQDVNKYITLGIDFSPTQIQGLQGVSGATNKQVEPYKTFNASFNGYVELVLLKQQGTNVLTTNRNINLPQNLATQFPYMSIFRLKNGNKMFYIYTKKTLKDYFVINQQTIQCVIGTNDNEFYAAEMIVNDIT